MPIWNLKGHWLTPWASRRGSWSESQRPSCQLYRYAIHFPMIRSFRHKGLRMFFETGSIAGIQPSHAARLRLQLAMLDFATTAAEMNLPGWRFHKLQGTLRDYHSVTVNKNWRLTFTFEGPDAILVDYQDYH